MTMGTREPHIFEPPLLLHRQPERKGKQNVFGHQRKAQDSQPETFPAADWIFKIAAEELHRPESKQNGDIVKLVVVAGDHDRNRV